MDVALYAETGIMSRYYKASSEQPRSRRQGYRVEARNAENATATTLQVDEELADF